MCNPSPRFNGRRIRSVERNAYIRRSALSGLRFFPLPLPLLMEVSRNLTSHASPYGKGRCHGVTEGIRRSVLDTANSKRRNQSAKKASLVMLFLPLLGAECRAGKEGNFAPTGQRGRENRDIAEQRSARTRLSLRLIFPQILVPFFREKMVRNGDVRGGGAKHRRG